MRRDDDDDNNGGGEPISRTELVVSDLFVSFMWVWLGSVVRYLACGILGSGTSFRDLVIKGPLAVLYLYWFSLLGKRMGVDRFLFVVFGRIPAQVLGSIFGVWFVNTTFPAAAYGPRLNVDMHHGALTEGVLTLTIVAVSLWLKKSGKSSSTKMWISSISKVMCHIISSDMTGGIMNPAAAFGWAYAQGQHLTKEHLCVYWLAPMEATLLGVWIASLFVHPRKLNRRQRQNEIRFQL
uniref:Aquaporin SIP2-1 n=1 Tax=Ananas comosus var. bracteatus TaxID=296719 RepID=A0A6V7NTR1_ANACO|nr:unnamed protein product [Ananas comosus var. bracteatus]